MSENAKTKNHCVQNFRRVCLSVKTLKKYCIYIDSTTSTPWRVCLSVKTLKKYCVYIYIYVAFKRLLFISCQTLDFLYVYQDFTPQFSSSKSFVDRLNLWPPKSNIIIFLLHGGVKALFVHTSPGVGSNPVEGRTKNLTALKSNSNTVWFNFPTYIYIYIFQSFNWQTDLYTVFFQSFNWQTDPSGSGCSQVV
jgi:hypothetical protein